MANAFNFFCVQDTYPPTVRLSLSNDTYPHITHTFSGDPNGFFEAVQWVFHQPVQPPAASSFSSEYTYEAAEHNSEILKAHQYDLEKALESQPGTSFSIGSEVRPLHQLEILLHHHKNFSRFATNITKGISYPIKPLDEDTRLELLEKQLKKGNHKSALEDEAKPYVTKAIQTDVIRGFGLIITKECASKITEAEIYPMSLQHQTTIDEQGNQIPKKRVCHDLSNDIKSGLSINQRVDKDLIPEVYFGYTLLRLLHGIHHLRYNYPNTRILLNKVDIEKAYRRLHVHPLVMAKCIATWSLLDNESKEREIAVALGRLPFGSMPAPSEFSNCSDMVTDLANDLMYLEQWDPDKLPCPLRDEIPPPKRLPDDIPFGPAYAPANHLPSSYLGGTDGYVDDLTSCVLDSPDNQQMVKRAEQCIPMALHLVFRPNAGQNEPIARAEMASIPKLKAEAYLTEILIMLGWRINTRTFTISLPDDKFISWKNQIKEMLTATSVSYKDASNLVGRLEHVAFIIPAARHFMNRLRRMMDKANKYRTAKVTQEVKKDLLLWIKFLKKANEGISINNIISREVTSKSLSDSCEMGIGGYGYNSGVAWRYQLPPLEQVSFDINQKEYLASAINQMIQLQYDNSPFPCSNDLTDNTSTAAWMYKSNFDPCSHPINNEIARANAENLLKHNACCYPQHLPGASNDIAHSLSRDFHLSNEQLIALFNHTKPPYFPIKQMRIIELPTEITSWIASLAQLRTNKRELKWERTPSTLARGVIGWSGSSTSEQMIPIFNPSHNPKEYASSVLSSTHCDEETSTPPGTVLKGKPRKRPSIMWRRPSCQVVGKTPGLTNQGTRASSSPANYKATRK